MDAFNRYYKLRKQIASLIPRMGTLDTRAKVAAVQEKGRKKNYSEYHISTGDMVKQEKLLNEQEVKSFLEISCRAAACPMCLNLDVYDALFCPYGCRYCFANAFRASLYTAFFDNSKTIGIRHCNPDYYKRELDKMFNKYRGNDPHSIQSDVGKAIAKGMPIRFGIRFEDFLPIEKKKGVSLALLKFLAENEYPLMINTKSDVVALPEYVEALVSNKAKTAVHVTLISSNNAILKNLEPGAPSYEARLEALKILSANGIRTVARIEPFLPFYADNPEEVQKYIADMKAAGVKNLTLDTYSYTAQNPGIRSEFIHHGVDFERLFTLTAESQAVGSLLLGAFMDIFREGGFSCSTFDMGNVPTNDQHVCCEVSDWFDPESFNFGCSVYAARYISKAKTPVSWGMYEAFVNKHGGFLNDALRKEVWELWNCGGNDAYSHSWAQGMEAVGNDANGIIWEFKKENDFRKAIVKGAGDL